MSVASDPRAMAGPRNIRCRVCPAALEIYCRSVGAYPWLRATTKSLAAALRFGLLSQGRGGQAPSKEQIQSTNWPTNRRTNK